jgi:hypothetical protein
MLEIGVRRQHRDAHVLDAVCLVDAELQRWVNRESKISLGGIADRVGE